MGLHLRSQRYAEIAGCLGRNAGVFAHAGSFAMKYGRPQLAVWFGLSPGDDLLCTAIFRELRKRSKRNLWMFTRNNGLFLNNTDIDLVLPYEYHVVRAFYRLGLPALTRIHYNEYNAQEDRDRVAEYHIIARMCEIAGITGDILLKPYLNLTGREISAGLVKPNQIVIHSAGALVYARSGLVPQAGSKFVIRTKEWFPERFQIVVDAMKSRYNFVQLGSPSDPLLHGALDLRGKTSLRESAGILSNSLVFVGQVGFLMHLARSVDCRSVIVYGGREAPNQSGYPCNVNLFSKLECSPCWHWNTCTNSHDMECMDRISPEMVIAAIEEQASRHGEPLISDTYTLPGPVSNGDLARNAESSTRNRTIEDSN